MGPRLYQLDSEEHVILIRPAVSAEAVGNNSSNPTLHTLNEEIGGNLNGLSYALRIPPFY